MSGELHHISLAIGELQAQAEEGTRQREKLFDSLEDLGKEVREGFAAMKAQLAAVPPLAQTVAEIKPKVENHERIKNRAIGLFLGGGASGAGIGELVRAIAGLWKGGA